MELLLPKPRSLWNGVRYGFRSMEQDAFEAIMKGEPIVSADETCLGYQAASSDAKLKRNLIKATENLYRVTMVQKYFHVDEVMKPIQRYKPVFTKNIKMAKMFKKQGDLYLKSQTNDKLALRAYNLALSFAPQKDPYIANICLKRAELLQKLGDLKCSLWDEQAVRNHFCSRKKIQILIDIESKGNVLRENQQKKDEIANANEKLVQAKKYRDEVIFKIHGSPSRTIPCASENVELSMDNEKGRQLIATDDLKTGTTILVEDPMVAAYDNEINWEMKHCFKCFKSIIGTIPCEHCVFAVYCSEKCREDDFAGAHERECPCLGYLSAFRAWPYVRLAFKAACTVELFEFLRVVRQEADRIRRKKTDDGASVIKGVDPTTGIYDSKSYSTLLCLKQHVSKSELLDTVWHALILEAILDATWQFPEPAFARNNEKDLIRFRAAAILDHLLAFPYNCLALHENPPNTVVNPEGTLTGVYSLFSMLNHSCEPSTFWTNLPSGKLAVITSREVAAGEELTMSYGTHFALHPLRQRNEMTSRHRFICQCLPCVQQWPVYNDISDVPKWICRICEETKNFSQEELIQKCILQETGESKSKLSLHCRNCDQTYNPRTLKILYVVYKSELRRIENLCRKRKDLVVIERLKRIMPFFQSRICPPWKESILAQDYLRQTVNEIIAKCNKSKDSI